MRTVCAARACALVVLAVWMASRMATSTSVTVTTCGGTDSDARVQGLACAISLAVVGTCNDGLASAFALATLLAVRDGASVAPILALGSCARATVPPWAAASVSVTVLGLATTHLVACGPTDAVVVDAVAVCVWSTAAFVTHMMT